MFETAPYCADNDTVQGIIDLATLQKVSLQKEVEKYCQERGI
jgi:hypothetical protein